MVRNNDRESEVVADNRQLLSVFFTVVILLGLFFTMGYIVGRSHAPVTTAAAAARPTETNPVKVVPEATPVEPTRAAGSPSAEKTAAEPIQKAKDQPFKAERAKVEPPKSEAPKVERAAPESSSARPSGTYLQLAATSKIEAEGILEALRQNRFACLATEIPGKAGMYRVLVGPVRDENVNKLRDELQDAGFAGKGAFKRTF